MSAFSNLLARIGIGAAKVDTRLEKDHYHQGEMVRGEVEVVGGNTSQEIGDISLHLVVEYADKEETKRIRWDQTRLAQAFTIGEGERQQIPFTWKLPMDLPVSGSGFAIYLRTGLDIEHAIDPTDSDRIEVDFHPKAKAMMEALQGLGFRRVKQDLEEGWKYGESASYVVEYEFLPSGKYRSHFDELEIAFIGRGGDLEVAMIIDKKAKGLVGSISESLGMDDKLLHFKISEEEIENVSMLQYRIESRMEAYL
ncbi:sporulation protein [Melghirimyces algeriensis]|uniref:Sporulation-control protein n=1 Tax=Melghirimyces algeriensis TaxID=910412 RepID=A0A521DFN8_9BACL|nr:sporulation protein [Melghirimyces algeriensis]SMO69750.1 sporulation-control protein [Melghirimyces algeriensis]